MTNGDMRYGSCGLCGNDEVYTGQFAMQGAIRSHTSGMGGKAVRFDTYICTSCGYTQLHTQLTEPMTSYIRRKLTRVRRQSPR